MYQPVTTQPNLETLKNTLLATVTLAGDLDIALGFILHALDELKQKNLINGTPKVIRYGSSVYLPAIGCIWGDISHFIQPNDLDMAIKINAADLEILLKHINNFPFGDLQRKVSLEKKLLGKNLILKIQPGEKTYEIFCCDETEVLGDYTISAIGIELQAKDRGPNFPNRWCTSNAAIVNEQGLIDIYNLQLNPALPPDTMFGQKEIDNFMQSCEAIRLFRGFFPLALFRKIGRPLSIAKDLYSQMPVAANLIYLNISTYDKINFYKLFIKYFTSGLKNPGYGFGSEILALCADFDLAKSIFPYFKQCQAEITSIISALDHSINSHKKPKPLLLAAFLLWPSFKYQLELTEDDFAKAWDYFKTQPTFCPQSTLGEIKAIMRSWVFEPGKFDLFFASINLQQPSPQPAPTINIKANTVNVFVSPDTIPSLVISTKNNTKKQRLSNPQKAELSSPSTSSNQPVLQQNQPNSSDHTPDQTQQTLEPSVTKQKTEEQESTTQPEITQKFDLITTEEKTIIDIPTMALQIEKIEPLVIDQKTTNAETIISSNKNPEEEEVENQPRQCEVDDSNDNKKLKKVKMRIPAELKPKKIPQPAFIITEEVFSTEEETTAPPKKLVQEVTQQGKKKQQYKTENDNSIETTLLNHTPSQNKQKDKISEKPKSAKIAKESKTISIQAPTQLSKEKLEKSAPTVNADKQNETVESVPKNSPPLEIKKLDEKPAPDTTSPQSTSYLRQLWNYYVSPYFSSKSETPPPPKKTTESFYSKFTSYFSWKSAAETTTKSQPSSYSVSTKMGQQIIKTKNEEFSKKIDPSKNIRDTLKKNAEEQKSSILRGLYDGAVYLLGWFLSSWKPAAFDLTNPNSVRFFHAFASANATYWLAGRRSIDELGLYEKVFFANFFVFGLTITCISDNISANMVDAEKKAEEQLNKSRKNSHRNTARIDNSAISTQSSAQSFFKPLEYLTTPAFKEKDKPAEERFFTGWRSYVRPIYFMPFLAEALAYLFLSANSLEEKKKVIILSAQLHVFFVGGVATLDNVLAKKYGIAKNNKSETETPPAAKTKLDEFLKLIYDSTMYMTSFELGSYKNPALRWGSRLRPAHLIVGALHAAFFGEDFFTTLICGIAGSIGTYMIDTNLGTLLANRFDEKNASQESQTISHKRK